MKNDEQKACTNCLFGQCDECTNPESTLYSDKVTSKDDCQEWESLYNFGW